MQPDRQARHPVQHAQLAAQQPAGGGAASSGLAQTSAEHGLELVHLRWTKLS
jgi:hypothetical protein